MMTTDIDDLGHALTKARDMAQYYKAQRDKWRAECKARAPNARLRARADELAVVASSLPDVVKTKALQRALSNYRRERHNES
jgi:hypothetical protein